VTFCALEILFGLPLEANPGLRGGEPVTISVSYCRGWTCAYLQAVSFFSVMQIMKHLHGT